jgi:hypothetical protein
MPARLSALSRARPNRITLVSDGERTRRDPRSEPPAFNRCSEISTLRPPCPADLNPHGPARPAPKRNPRSVFDVFLSRPLARPSQKQRRRVFSALSNAGSAGRSRCYRRTRARVCVCVCVEREAGLRMRVVAERPLPPIADGRVTAALRRIRSEAARPLCHSNCQCALPPDSRRVIYGTGRRRSDAAKRRSRASADVVAQARQTRVRTTVRRLVQFG